MAKLDKKGNPKGKIGNEIYRQLNGETIVQSKPGKIKQTTNTQISAQEFGLCSNATKIIRQMGSYLFEYTDPYLSGRLTAVMRQCVAALPQDSKEKNLNDIDPSPFIGFQFNPKGSFEKNLLLMPQCTVQPDGTLIVQLNGLTPEKHIPFLQTNIQPYPGSFLRIAVLGLDYQRKEYQLLAVDEIILAKAKMDDATLPYTHDVHWQCLKQLQKGTLVFVFLSLHYYQLDWLKRRKTMGDKHQLPSGILTAFRVDDDLYERNRQVAIGVEHQPVEEAEWFYTIRQEKQFEINRLKDHQQKKDAKRLQTKQFRTFPN
ncbi:hypothetical protein GCM10023231_04390 [Olivibacter ginsenosidimutans]|uniref:Uncharacterized protein n=1 Tax=Olivibacter ginsenosidimutans TaxID=1176537 RepID=A0ABP9AGE8_9SPHI